MDLGREGTAVDPKVAQVAEGKVFDFKPESSIKPDFLKAFEFDSPKQLITIETHEFVAVCPFSGILDVAKVKIQYYPEANLAIELKSLKYYILSYAGVGVYQERANMLIYNHLKDVLKTKRLTVEMIYNVRGGFLTTTTEGSL